MTLLILTGPQAVGKMTVGQSVASRTELVLFHNHATIELVLPFFSYGSRDGRALVASLREQMFRAIAASDHPGMIFTYVWAFDLPEEHAYIHGLAQIFADTGRRVCWVELEADLDTRLMRNLSPNRLAHKPSKRDTAASEAMLLEAEETYRMNSDPGELTLQPYLRIDTTDMTPEDTAERIVAHFGL